MSGRPWLLLLALVGGAAPAPAAPPAQAEAEEWSVSATPRAAGEASSAVLDLRLTSRAGYHVNLDYPMAFLPSPEGTIRFQERRVPLRPASKEPCARDPREVCSVALELPYTPPHRAGARLAGTLAFSVCSAERCLIQKVPLTVDVSGPSRSPGG